MEVLADQISAKFPDRLVFGASHLVDVDDSFPLGSPGTQFKIPFWKRIPAFAALTEATAMETNKIQTGAEFAIVQRQGVALAVSDPSELVSKADPVGEIANQLARRAAEAIDNALVGRANNTPNLFDQTGVNQTNANGTFDSKTAIKAMISTVGDNYSKLVGGGAAIIMHSKVLGDLIETDAIQNRYQSGTDTMLSGNLPTIAGLPILSSDLVTVGNQSGKNLYSSYIVGPKALALFYQRQVMIEFDRDILSKEDLISADVNFAPHLYGYDDVSAAYVWEQAKSCLVVKIVSY